MPRAGIALGSNLEPRLQNLRRAFRHLCALHEGREAPLASRIYETAPVDCPPGSPDFLNAVAEIESSLPPLELLHALIAFERTHGRIREGTSHEPRPIDLDLLYWGDACIDSPQLTLPHPRMLQRPFVVHPLADIRPEFAGHRIFPSQIRVVLNSLFDL